MRCSSFRANACPFAKDRFFEARIGLLVSAGESSFHEDKAVDYHTDCDFYFALQSLLSEATQVKLRRPKKQKSPAASGLAFRLPALRPRDF